MSAYDPRGLRRSISVIDELKRQGVEQADRGAVRPVTHQTAAKGFVRLLEKGLPDVIVVQHGYARAGESSPMRRSVASGFFKMWL